MYNKKRNMVILLTLIISSLIGVCTYYFNSKTNASKSNQDSLDYSNVKRDTSITTDTNGNLVVNRSEIEDEYMGEDGTWTVLVYVCVSDLQESAARDISLMLEASNSNYGNGKVNILIQTGGGTKSPDMISGVDTTKSQRYKVEKGNLTLLEEGDKQNMASPETLYNFLEWGVENYPAENMAVLLWNHGGGTAFGLMQDTLYDRDTMTLSQLEYTFAKISKKMSDKFEFIGFDTCLSGSIEYANALAPYANYMFASPIEVLAILGCIRSDYMINYLYDNPNCTGKDLGKALIDDAKSLAKVRKEFQYISFYDLSAVDEVCIEFNKLAKNLYETLYNNYTSAEIYKALCLIQNNTNYLHMKYTCDLGSFLKSIDNNPTISCDTTGVRNALNKLIIDCQMGTKYEKKGGLGINLYFPKKVMSIEELNLYRNNSVSPYWLKYLELTNARRKSDTMDRYIENNWENSELYFEKNFDFIKYEKIFIYSNPFFSKTAYEELIKNPIYANDGFAQNWYKVLSQETSTTDKLLVALYSKINDIKLKFKKSEEVINVNTTLDEDVVNSVYGVYSSVFKKIDDKLVCLGSNPNVSMDKNTGKISTKFSGEWFVLADGQVLTTYIISQDKDEIIYGLPVDIDGLEATIRVQEIIKDNKKEYKILGIWDGTENSLRGARGGIELEAGMEITPIYDLYDEENESYETEYGEVYEVQGKEDILFSNLKNGNYYYTITFEDYNSVITHSPMKEFIVTDDGVEFR